MRGVAASLLALLTLLGLGGCASQELVVLMPGADGSAGALAVSRGESGETMVLSQPMGSAEVGMMGGLSHGKMDVAEMHEQFDRAHAAMPRPPTSYLVYFVFGTTQPTTESSASLAAALADLRDRPGADIEVIGHTDRVGTLKHNDILSRERAAVIRSRLEALAIDSALITVAGRGEREPLVPTPDEVEEPRNRRVEIIVR